jgi:hypothetical protein
MPAEVLASTHAAAAKVRVATIRSRLLPPALPGSVDATVMASSHLPELLQALPMDDAVRIEPCDGVPVFRATPRVQERIEDLLEAQTERPLSAEEARELLAFEELDELLSLVNRIVRNSAGGSGGPLAQTA